uniref:Histone acetyltransferase n=1 Tax=Ditylenchus dipsaci TaxID=166011 RepID=A0A915DMP2_9BILA
MSGSSGRLPSYGSCHTSTKGRNPVVEKIFDADELRSYLQPVCEKLYKLDEAIPFRIPVDPEALQVPDYFDIVKQPMDLGTISQKLSTGKYKNPWEFCDDVWLMFENAWLYNRKNSKVYKWCSQLSKIFINEINPVMKKIGYCCGQKLSFTPLTPFCNGRSACVIARDQAYHLYVSTQCGVSFAERYIYCQKCFDKLPKKESVSAKMLKDLLKRPRAAKRPGTKTFLTKNQGPPRASKGREAARYWVKIHHGSRDNMILSRAAKRPGTGSRSTMGQEPPRASKGREAPGIGCRRQIPLKKLLGEGRYTQELPHCHLSRHIEDGVNEFIEEQVSQGTGQSYEVVIRVLSSVVKEVELKLHMEQK